MGFEIDKENRTIRVKREFAAPVLRVWSAWTKAEMLDQWWAPKPWKTHTGSMDFREGGKWIYAMLGPEGEKHWARADFKDISELREFSVRDCFSDENGEEDHNLPTSFWNLKFKEKSPNSTEIEITITYKESADLERILNMGFKEGFTAGMDNLDTLLAENREEL